MPTRLDPDTPEGKAEIEELKRDVNLRFPKVYVLHWGATMTLASFFVIKDVEGSKKKVALKLAQCEFGEFGVSERVVPKPQLRTDEIFSVRFKEHDEYSGLAPDVQIFHSGEWKTVRIWDGKAQIQNTCD